MTREQWAKLSIEEQRIKVAECAKWESTFKGYDENGGICSTSYTAMPDYINDLNAMHEAEKCMPDRLWGDYEDLLTRLTAEAEPIHASATDRAEAFVLIMHQENGE